MNCKRCKTVELVRVHFPPTHREAPSGRPLAAYVDRCPCCGLEVKELPEPEPTKPKKVTRKRKLPQVDGVFTEYGLFDPVVGGFKAGLH